MYPGQYEAHISQIYSLVRSGVYLISFIWDLSCLLIAILVFCTPSMRKVLSRILTFFYLLSVVYPLLVLCSLDSRPPYPQFQSKNIAFT
jgi:hypothetical protein